MSDFNKAIQVVLNHEGGFVDDPNDDGGATNFGISLRFLRSLNNLDYDFNKDEEITVKDIKNLTKEQAILIYKNEFWNKNMFECIDKDDCSTKLFDASVNIGPSHAFKLAQISLGAFVDGILGPQTIEKINNVSPDFFLKQMRFQMRCYYLELIRRKPELKKYQDGWLKRAAF
jgi:lysozyme family protein